MKCHRLGKLNNFPNFSHVSSHAWVLRTSSLYSRQNTSTPTCRRRTGFLHARVVVAFTTSSYQIRRIRRPGVSFTLELRNCEIPSHTPHSALQPRGTCRYDIFALCFSQYGYDGDYVFSSKTSWKCWMTMSLISKKHAQGYLQTEGATNQ